MVLVAVVTVCLITTIRWLIEFSLNLYAFNWLPSEAIRFRLTDMFGLRLCNYSIKVLMCCHLVLEILLIKLDNLLIVFLFLREKVIDFLTFFDNGFHRTRCLNL